MAFRLGGIKMKNIKVSIMTNKSYPSWKVVDQEMNIDESKVNYQWRYEDFKLKYQDSKNEYPVEIQIQWLD